MPVILVHIQTSKGWRDIQKSYRILQPMQFYTVCFPSVQEQNLSISNVSAWTMARNTDISVLPSRRPFSANGQRISLSAPSGKSDPAPVKGSPSLMPCIIFSRPIHSNGRNNKPFIKEVSFVHHLVSRIESELDQIRSMCQQLEQAERSNQQLAQQLQSFQADPNLRTQLQNMAQKEALNAQKLQQISQIASQARQEISQLRQQGITASQPRFQQQPSGQTSFQPQPAQPMTPQYRQPAGSQQLSSSTQEWVQRHMQRVVSPHQALRMTQQGVPQQSTQPYQPVQTTTPIQSMRQQPVQHPLAGQYRNQKPYYQQ